MSNHIFPFLIIPLPTEIPVGFGIHATSGPHGVFIQCRGLVAEREYINRAATKLGLPYGSFIRRTLIDSATAVLHQFDDAQPNILPKDVTHRTED